MFKENRMLSLSKCWCMSMRRLLMGWNWPRLSTQSMKTPSTCQAAYCQTTWWVQPCQFCLVLWVKLKKTDLSAGCTVHCSLVDGRLTGASLASHRELLRWRRLHRDMPLLWYNYTLSEPVQRRRSFVLVMFMSTDEVLFWCHLRHCVSYTAQNFLWSFVHSSGLNSVGYLDQDWVPEIVKP